MKIDINPEAGKIDSRVVIRNDPDESDSSLKQRIEELENDNRKLNAKYNDLADMYKTEREARRNLSSKNLELEKIMKADKFDHEVNSKVTVEVNRKYKAEKLKNEMLEVELDKAKKMIRLKDDIINNSIHKNATARMISATYEFKNKIDEICDQAAEELGVAKFEIMRKAGKSSVGIDFDTRMKTDDLKKYANGKSDSVPIYNFDLSKKVTRRSRV